MVELAGTGGDNECGSLRFPAASGRRQMWQVFQTNFAEDTFCTLTGLWAGGTTAPAVLTYGVEIRQGDQNGTMIAQTDPAQATEFFTWYPFSKVLIVPAGPQDITIVVYGENSDAVDAGVHVDELLLRVGAKFWPDVDDDGDIDQTDFASFQRCYTGSEAGSLSEGCERFDREADLDVDAADFEAFEKCSTGAGVPLTPTGALAHGCEL
ncbi:MAG: hypothetical protein ACUVXJ_01630 [Phycisphaerae bacterium]